MRQNLGKMKNVRGGEEIVNIMASSLNSETTLVVEAESPITDSQVKVKKHTPRRTYDAEYKSRILSALANCESASERGALLRREGLYHSRICAWKQQQENEKLTSKQPKGLRVDHLSRENEQLKKRLAHAEAIIDLQKKISNLLGIHTLSTEINESK